MKTFEIVALFMGTLLTLSSCYGEEKIYKSSANFDLAWAANEPDGEAIPLSNLYAFENEASAFISRLLEEEEVTGLLSGKHLLVTTANVKDQRMEFETGMVESKTAIVGLKVSLLIVYTGDEKIGGLDSILTEVLAQDQRKEELLRILKFTKVVDPYTKLASVSTSFSVSNSVEESDPIFAKSAGASSRSRADKALIIACTFLSIALIFVSLVLLWVVVDTDNQQCFTFFRRRVKSTMKKGVTLKLGSKDDVTHVTSASGVLGANPNYDTENVPPPTGAAGAPKMTPYRGVYRDEMTSPMSLTTAATNYTDTDASRPPLGIRSIRKLKLGSTPDKKQTNNPYRMSKLTYT